MLLMGTLLGVDLLISTTCSPKPAKSPTIL